MSNQWLRLWHDMPNDPKWRTIARASIQPISLVQAVYLHLLVDASRNVTRGHVTVTVEDLASALDVTDEAIEAILDAMQGRVLDGSALSGWEKRQPKREDAGDPETGAKSAAQRKREQREREKKQAAEGDETPCHEESRDVTTDKDKDKDKDIKTHVGDKSPPCPHQEIIDAYHEHCPTLPQVKIWNSERQKFLKSRWRESPKHQTLEFWRGYFRYVAQSPFLLGSDGAWQADLEWLIRPTNFAKVVEGKYHRGAA